MPLTVGTIAPDFKLRTLAADGLADVTLSQHHGSQNVVLLFFPAAFTGVCTQEMCDLSNGLHTFKEASVYGISSDSPFALDAWAKANGITVPLLSDYAKEVTALYDVVLPDLVGLGKSTARAAYVIDKEGVIRYAEQTNTPLDLPNFDAIQATLAGL